MSNEASRHLPPRAARGVVAVVDAIEAIVRTELLCVRALWGPKLRGELGKVVHAFDEKVELLGDDLDDATKALAACEASAAKGARAAAIVSAASLADARRSLARLVDRRRGVVIHAIVSPKGREPNAAGYGDVHAIADVGAGVLLARDAQDASDLTLIAHRAAEDAEAPIVVVHDGYPASYARDRIVLPDAPMVRAALEPAPPPLAPAADDALPGHRRAAARVPFALASAMRAFERLSGRKIDQIESHHMGNAEVALVAAGAIAETARAIVEHLRAKDGSSLLSTPDGPLHVGIVQITTLRPFPGAQLAKALGRARAIAVLERIDAPLAQSNPLAVEIKAAFADALTWTPGYPGIGRIPQVFAGSIEPASDEATPGAIHAVLDNLLLGEQGRRVFHLGGKHPHPQAIAASEERSVHPPSAFVIGCEGDPSLLAYLLGDLYGAHVRATPRRSEGDREAFDLTVSPSPVHAHHGGVALDIVVVDASTAASNAQRSIDRLGDGATVVLLGLDRAKLSSHQRAAIDARKAHVFSVPKVDGGTTGHDAALLGAILVARAPSRPEGGEADRRQVLADVERSLRAGAPSLADREARSFVEQLDRALQSTTELPSGT